MNHKSGENKIAKLISRYENMLNNNTQSFFDTHEFEDIADHYIEKGLLGEAMGSMEMASTQYPFSANFLMFSSAFSNGVFCSIIFISNVYV